MKQANLVVRFLVELCALAALAYWRFNRGEIMARDTIFRNPADRVEPRDRS
jgi:hypothetical protein